MSTPADSIKVYVIDAGRKFFYLQWTDPKTGKRETRSSKCTKKRDAETARVRLEAELNQRIPKGDGSLLWKDFLVVYHDRETSSMDEATEKWHISKLHVYEKTMKPETLASLDSVEISRYIAKLRGLGRAEDTIRGHIIAIRCALEWAVGQGHLATLPILPEAKLRTSRGRKVKGRDLTFWEFVKMLRAVSLVVTPPQVASWRHLLIGLWISGLRLAEAAELSWDDPIAPRVSLKEKYPVIEIDAEDDKGRTTTSLPITDDFERFLLRTPESERHGHVFNPLGERGHPINNETNLSRTISEIGEKAGIVVDHRRGKFASAQDLRRTFGTRWAPRVYPVVLQKLMRHKDIKTTTTYYANLDAQKISAEVRKSKGGKNHSTFDSTPPDDSSKES